MKRDEALERMEEIQRIAERTTLYTVLPGQAAVIGGILVFAGCIASYVMLGTFDAGQLIRFSASDQLLLIIMWAVIGVIAIAQEVLLTTRDARRQGLLALGRPGRLSAYSLTPSILVAVVLSINLYIDSDTGMAAQNMRYIAPIWMMCYGTGIYAAGLFSLRLPRLLGLAFIISGALGILFFERYGLLMVAFSFGLLHVIFGVIVIRRKRRNSVKE